VHEGVIEFCDPGEPGTHPPWTPAPVARNTVLGAVAATSSAIAKEARRVATAELRKASPGPADRPHIDPPRRAPLSPLRRAALSGSCFSGALERIIPRIPVGAIAASRGHYSTPC
jgi:hypothetical protein